MPTPSRDIELYYRDTIVFDSDRAAWLVRAVWDDRLILSDKTGSEKVVNFQEFYSDYNLYIPDLGYFLAEAFPVYIQNHQGRSPKKALFERNLTTFLPQREEIDSRSIRLNVNLISIVSERVFTRLEDVDEALSTAHGCIIHKNFAIVKKGFCEHPVVYHRTLPVAMWVDGGFHPLDGDDEIFIEKILLELGS